MIRKLAQSAQRHGVAAHFALSAVLVALFLGIFLCLCQMHPVDRSLSRHTEVSVQVQDRETLDYRDGSWWADGQRVPLACHFEDSCELQVVGPVAWFVQVR